MISISIDRVHIIQEYEIFHVFMVFDSNKSRKYLIAHLLVFFYIIAIFLCLSWQRSYTLF